MLRAIAVAVAVFLALPMAAYANGDPASDVLLTDTVFVPYQAPSRERSTSCVASSTGRARRASRCASRSSTRRATSARCRHCSAIRANTRSSCRGELVNPVEPGARGSRLAAARRDGRRARDRQRAARGGPQAARDRGIAQDASPGRPGRRGGLRRAGAGRANGKPIPATFGSPRREAGEGRSTAVLIVLALAALVSDRADRSIRVRGRAETDSVACTGTSRIVGQDDLGVVAQRDRARVAVPAAAADPHCERNRPRRRRAAGPTGRTGHRRSGASRARPRARRSARACAVGRSSAPTRTYGGRPRRRRRDADPGRHDHGLSRSRKTSTCTPNRGRSAPNARKVGSRPQCSRRPVLRASPDRRAARHLDLGRRTASGERDGTESKR